MNIVKNENICAKMQIEFEIKFYGSYYYLIRINAKMQKNSNSKNLYAKRRK